LGGPAEPARVPLTWSRWIGMPVPRTEASRPRHAVSAPPTAIAGSGAPRNPSPTAEAVPRAGTSVAPTSDALAVGPLAEALSRSTTALAEAHRLFLRDRDRATDRLVAMSRTIDR